MGQSIHWLQNFDAICGLIVQNIPFLFYITFEFTAPRKSLPSLHFIERPL